MRRAPRHAEFDLGELLREAMRAFELFVRVTARAGQSALSQQQAGVRNVGSRMADLELVVVHGRASATAKLSWQTVTERPVTSDEAWNVKSAWVIGSQPAARSSYSPNFSNRLFATLFQPPYFSNRYAIPRVECARLTASSPFIAHGSQPAPRRRSPLERVAGRVGCGRVAGLLVQHGPGVGDRRRSRHDQRLPGQRWLYGAPLRLGQLELVPASLLRGQGPPPPRLGRHVLRHLRPRRAWPTL